MRPLRYALLVFMLVPCVSTLLHAGVITFDFESDLVGTTTQFTDTLSGLSATFSSSPDAGGFTIQSFAIFQGLMGNFLMDEQTENLTIAFSAPLTSISMNFATSGDGIFNLDAYSGGTGGTLVGSNSSSGSIPSGFILPEGSLTFNSGTFDTVVLSSTAANFAIDNVAATDPPPDVPEPASFLLCGGALAALSFVRFRRRS